MMNKKQIIIAATVVLGSSVAWAGSIGILNSFISGTPALASQVNANFTAIKTAVDDNNTRINTVTASATTNIASVASNTTAVSGLQGAASLLLRTVLVKPVIAGGVVDAVASGTALINAVASIVSSSPTNPYLVKLEAGIYDLGSQGLSLPTGVSIEGAGRAATEITSSVAQNMTQPLAATIILNGNSVVSYLKVTNTNATTTGFGGTRPSAITLNGGGSSNNFYYIDLVAEQPLIIDRGSFARVSSSKLIASTNSLAIWKTGPSSSVDVISSDLSVAGNAAGVLISTTGGERCVNSHRNFTALSTACL